MLKVPVLIISALVLILVVATVFKQHQRKILWSAAIVLFVGTLLLVGFGVIDPVGETRPNLPALTGIIMALVPQRNYIPEIRESKMKSLRKTYYMSNHLLQQSALSCRSVSIPNLPARFSHAR